MKTTYIQPSIIEVRLQHHSIICTSTTPDGYDDSLVFVESDGTITDEGFVWIKESHNIWDEEW